MPDGLEIVTFGCRLNSFESEVMRERAAQGGLQRAIIFNTCAVTGEAVRQARQAIRRARRNEPDRPVVVTGCAAQIDPHRFAAMDEVDAVLGNEEKLHRDSYRSIDPGSTREGMVRVDDIMSVRQTLGHGVDGFAHRARAFVQIQNGCDHRCTFCVIPFGRGNSRSVPAGEVVKQVRRLVEHGHREVVLTGVDITAYGADLPACPGLGALVREILRQVPELRRLRLSSIDSVETDDTLLRAFAEEDRLMPHVHLSLQAGDDLILKRMKRRHDRRSSIAWCNRLRDLRPDIVFGADLIAGFPTENEQMFANTLGLVADCGLTWLHVFPFSPRPGTPAARMPQLDRELVRERAARLRALGAQRVRGFLEGEVGQRRTVLVERPGDGRTEHYAPIDLDGAGVPGDLLEIDVTAAGARRLAGRVH